MSAGRLALIFEETDDAKARLQHAAGGVGGDSRAVRCGPIYCRRRDLNK